MWAGSVGKLPGYRDFHSYIVKSKIQTWEMRVEIPRRTTERFHMYDMLWSRLLFYDGTIWVVPDKRKKWETVLGFSSASLLWITYTS